MKIAWLDINSSYSHSSLAIPALDAQLDETTRSLHEWKIISGILKTDEKEIIQSISEFSPDVILSTLWLFNHDYVIRIIKKVKRLCPDALVLMGGPEFLGDNENFLREHPEIDSVFKGEGEEIFKDFVSDISNYRNINGFCYLTEDRTYHDSEEMKATDFRNCRYPETSRYFRWDKSFIQIETSRGCFNSCNFCISGKGGKYNEPGIETIRPRIQNALDHGIHNIRVLDRTFNADSRRACSMLDIFTEFSGQMKFHIEIHPALMSPLFQRKLQALPEGLLHIEAGIQSLDDQVIGECRRKGKVADALKGLDFLCGLKKFEIHADLIAGLPHYTLPQLKKDILQLMQTGITELQLELLKLLPGTPFRNNAGMLGIRYSPLPPYEVLETGNITYRELGISMLYSKALDYWFNSDIWRDIIVRMEQIRKGSFFDLAERAAANGLGTMPFSQEKKGLILYEFLKDGFPELIPDICIQWLSAGYSPKKGPGEEAILWNRRKISGNPIEDEDRETNYYFIEKKESRIWIAYKNKKVLRTMESPR